MSYTGSTPDTESAADWRALAACGGMDSRIFFSDSYHSREQVRAAKAICYACPVLAVCRAWAIENGENWGVWGGMSQFELRRRRRRFTSRARTSTRAAA